MHEKPDVHILVWRAMPSVFSRIPQPNDKNQHSILKYTIYFIQQECKLLTPKWGLNAPCTGLSNSFDKVTFPTSFKDGRNVLLFEIIKQLTTLFPLPFPLYLVTVPHMCTLST